MQTVEQEIIVYAPKDLISKMLYRVEDFPRYMDDVQEVRILERDRGRQISSWRINIDGVELQWIEEEIMNYEKGRMDYRLLKGDFESFEGSWLLQTPQGLSPSPQTRVRLDVHYDLGLPHFEELIGGILRVKVERNTKSLLKALKTRVEGGGYD